MQRIQSLIAGRRVVTVAGLLALAMALGATRASAVPPAELQEDPDGCFFSPSLYCKRGDHRFDLKLVSRYRTEFWKGRGASDQDSFHALRTRIGGMYRYAELLTLYGEFQDARIYDMGTASSGAAAVYRGVAGQSDISQQHFRQGWAEIKPIDGLALKGGRIDIKGGLEVTYPEPNWKYLKVARASQRLVGGVGWTHGERANDAAAVSYDFGDYHIKGFGGKPTTGVFEIRRGYKTQNDITYGGLQFTAKRDVWLPNTENRLFFIAYDDDRPVTTATFLDHVRIWTLGFSSIGVHELGPGNVDLFLWLAGQWGDYGSLDHGAVAGIVEAGYQFTEVPWKPWIRTGVNIASGDGNPADGDHETFFNLLPTNHLYYGFADQLAFQNVIDFIAQLKLQPAKKVGLNLMYHRFWLTDDGDTGYVGSGAFNKTAFGYVPYLNPGSTNDVGHELDVILGVKVHKHVDAQFGYARMWGGDLFAGVGNSNVDFGYLQLVVKY